MPRPAKAAAVAERFRAQPLDFAALLDNRAHPLAELGRKWRDSAGEFDATVSSFASQDTVLPRLMIVGVPHREAAPVFRYIGEGLFPWLPCGYHRQALGEPLSNFPDRGYGAWLAGFYAAVARDGAPRFDRVRAEIDRADGEVYATQYERLLLPWRGGSRETLVSLVVRKVEAMAPISAVQAAGAAG
ncbi:MAG TPA: hypothetical protein VG651_09545 [Stellaceae bacterium]|nr:hypothetical protein [Stellaceae bacterium]